MLPWQQHSRCHSVSFVMYVSGAKFGKTLLPIFLEIFFIECCIVLINGTAYDVIAFLICIIQKRKYL